MHKTRREVNEHTTTDEVIKYYWCYLSRNKEYATHFEQFKKRYNSDKKSAEAEAVVFSLFRAEKLKPEIFEDPSTGGPDFICNPSSEESFLLEVTSLDSASVSKKSDLPLTMSGAGRGAFGLITDKLLSAVKSKTKQLSGRGLPGVLVITSAYDFSGLLLDRMSAECLMTSAPQFNEPLNGGPDYMTTDLRNAVFCRPGLFNASGEQMFLPCRKSVSAILLIQIYPSCTRIVGLLHPEPAIPFNPNWFPKVPYLRFRQWPLAANNIDTEWILGDHEHEEATFVHRRIS